MNPENDEVIQIFRDSGALLEGHFLLRSGLHSAHFFQCAQVCQYMDKVTRLAEIMVPMLEEYGATTVVGEEKDQGVVVLVAFLEGGHDGAYPLVEAVDHGGVDFHISAFPLFVLSPFPVV